MSPSLQRLRFERMLGQYRAAMTSAHGEGEALERAYGSFGARLSAAALIQHAVAPVWLELTSPQAWLADMKQHARNAGLTCDACGQVKAVEEIKFQLAPPARRHATAAKCASARIGARITKRCAPR